MSEALSAAIARVRKALATAEAAAALGDYPAALQASHAAEDHAQSLSHALVQAQLDVAERREQQSLAGKSALR